MNRRIISIVLMMLLFGLLAGCDSTVGTSTGGATLEFGTAIDKTNLKLSDTGTTFKANEEFYWVFNNNAPFGTDTISIILNNAATNEKMGEQPYKVKAKSTMYASTLGFTAPGKYRVEMAVAGKVVVKQEVNIQ
ncbi:MAG: hypothetical protein ACM3UZ_01525 [Acidobacteriota bacterium]